MKSGTTKLTHVISSQDGDSVTGVTSLGNGVFVVRLDSRRRVEVYDASTFTLQRYITVPGLGIWSYGLAACAHYKCLYVSDYDHSSIHRAELSGSNAVKKWLVGRRPRGLSVNEEHNVVVMCGWARKIREYTSHGALVRAISLEQAGVRNPWHAVQLSTGDYVVSERKSPGAVIVVGIDGHVVRRYCPSPSSDVGKMISPRNLAVTKNDWILVNDRDKTGILLMNRSLSSVRELVLPVDDGMHRPRGLCLDESRGRLYVGEYNGSHRVLVFDGVRLCSCNCRRLTV